MSDYLERTWVEIDMDAAEHNYRLAKEKAGSAEVMCIVKADAYGHGVEHMARLYQKLGAKWFGVSNIHEAMELRRCGIEGDILILGYTPPRLASALADNSITQAVFSEKYAEELSLAALSLGMKVKCHLKIDTGMGRIGIPCRNDGAIEEAAETAARICENRSLDFTGIFMHFCVADEGRDGEKFTKAQYRRFTSVIERLGKKGITFRWRHCSNSACTLEYPEMHLDMVRPGIILYGLSPSSVMRGKYDLRPVMQFKSTISMIKTLEKGATVSYGRHFTAPEDMRVATVVMGYADGYARSLSGSQEVLVRGRRAPIIGNICMDQLMIDISSIPEACEGDIVTAFGRDGSETISLDELADKVGTINYELTCRVTRRVARAYLKNGVLIAETDYLL